MLALTVIGAWSRLRDALQKQFGNTFAWWFTIISVTQYHFMFYMSRPLPNIMALPLVLLAFEGWISGKHKLFLISAGAAIVIFRSELAMLFGLFLIIDLYFKKIDFKTLFKIVVPAGAGLVALTVVVDSIFWRRLLWPEAEVFLYNTVMNKSSDWGTSPFLWYFYSALPRGLGPSLVLIPAGVYLDRRLVQYAAPAFVYILLYSLLPHKELRFIIYVFPLLNMASAAACSYIYIRKTKAPLYELLFWGTIVVIVGNIVMSLAFVLVAMTNYPGGVAITRFHKLLKDEPFVHVHISNLAAQTGVTRFTQINDNWIYSKNESLQIEQLQEYTHLIVEAKSKYSANMKAFANTHVVLDSIDSFSQIAMNYKLIPPIKIKTKPALFILEMKGFSNFPSRPIHKSSAPVSEESVEESVDSVNDKDNTIPSSSIIAGEAIMEESSQIDKPISKEVIDGEVITPIEKSMVDEETTTATEDLESQKLPKAKKALDEFRSLRQERKKKAIEKIKLETRKEVVASAKEKLRDIMKRHKHIAHELADNKVTEDEILLEDKDGRGDIPEKAAETGEIEIPVVDKQEYIEPQNVEPQDTDTLDDILQLTDTDTNENIDAIVEEVIVRLIDRKIYDDKTKPEDIKAEDRQIIQKIVEEVLAERMNYSNAEIK
ncbi:dol-P-Man:Man(7)GlcNAc(2)-PP-Dol alpha-1,6-mannosyltransferase isoform X2 [Plodia interpunctella]|nr:dol-P-Man:Man(7)GlcNAc(2)-PP-Dol alpha-1,6-mannosyltransferase isoform X2 [Plodia interpunctella]